LHALHLNSDELGTRELCRHFERAMNDDASVMLDSTGMSWRIRGLIRAHRSRIVHVHLLLRDERQFAQREQHRTDRLEAPVPLAAFKRSQRVAFHDAPDLALETGDLTPDEVYDRVRSALVTP
jgi:hypothetical protein